MEGRISINGEESQITVVSSMLDRHQHTVLSGRHQCLCDGLSFGTGRMEGRIMMAEYLSLFRHVYRDGLSFSTGVFFSFFLLKRHILQ